MEAKLAQSLQFSTTCIDSEKMVRKPSGLLLFSPRASDQKRLQVRISSHLQPTRTASWHKPAALKVSCSYKNFPAVWVKASGTLKGKAILEPKCKAEAHLRLKMRVATCLSSHGKPTRPKAIKVPSKTYPVFIPSSGPIKFRCFCFEPLEHNSILKSGSFPASFDEAMTLKNKSEEIEPYLNGRCIYLVGMMGSGKTTIGRILSEVLGYSFFDCDTLIEHTVGGTSVAEIFKLYGESFFRDNETEVLQKLSLMHRLVVSTGGGAVIRPINWKYMQKGISVWLDVPLEALARRIAAIGTESRPLLHHDSGDAYAKAFNRLSTLLEERGEAYANANARVSLENIASKLGYIDVCNLTPTVIAIEKDSDAVKEALDPLSEVGCANKWSSQPYVSRHMVSVHE
ncbi:hypothetical protein TEA_027996 [Camellia sinensis var. sinensis]|uniref:shikimate kinase n=1 Tax=Camellia sinensis var. sinensis TaxID=542762 RepID=A0A4S4F2V4_CAMSN|nr:hypothetical protein TEA_027996 [Camellia sinensis var. sinensis]